MSQMLCSTIIPTVNRPSLERAVRSALVQDVNPDQHEVIIVNDSGEALKKSEWLLSTQVKVINTYRCDRSIACNVGVAVARGKYIKILHDDDYLLPGALKALIEVLETSGCVWVHGVHNRVDDNDNFISINLADVRGNIFALLVTGETIHLGQSLISRDAFIRVGGFDPRLHSAEDRDLECQIALTSNFERTDHVIANIRVGTGGKSTTDWSKATIENREIREKALNAPAALPRLLDSIQGNVHLRGRCCRAYLLSAVLNLRSGRIFIAFSRFFSFMRLAVLYPILPNFWRGLFYRTYWHSVERRREVDHYSTYFNSKGI